MLKNLFDRYIYFVTAHPAVVLITIALLTVAMTAGLPRFKLDASSESLTLENDTDLDFYREVTKDFQSGDALIVTFKPNEDLFSDASLNVLKNLRDDLAQIDGVAGVNSLIDVPLLYSPKQTIAEILREPRNLAMKGIDKNLAKQEFLTSPIYKDMLLGPDGQTTALQLNIAVDTKYISLVRSRDSLTLKEKHEGLNTEETALLAQLERTFLEYRTFAQNRNHKRVEDVRSIVAKYKPHAEIYVGGVTMITADMITFIEKDLIVFGSAVVIFMIVILAIIFRSVHYVVIPMACCLISVLIMLGYVSWLDWRLTVISSNFVALLLIVSLAIIIHLIVRYREYARENPEWTQKELVISTVRFMARPCFYTTITTIVAFASLVVSGIRPVIDFGWMMSIGLVVALILSFLVMPAALMLLPREVPSASEKSGKTKLPSSMAFSWTVEKFGGGILIAALIVAGLSALGISRLDVENRFIDYFRDSTEIYQGLSVIDNNLGGTTSLEILIRPNLEDPSTPDVKVIVNSENTADIGEDDPFGDDPFGEDDPFAEDSQFAEGSSFAEGSPFAEGSSSAVGSSFAEGSSPSDELAEDDPFGGDDDFSDDPFSADDGFGSSDEASTQSSGGSYWLTVAGISRIEKLHDYLESVPEVGKVQSLATLYKVGRDLNGGLNGFELALLERSLAGEVRDVLISPYLGPNGEQTRISLRIRDLYPGLKRAELEQRMHSHIIESGMFEESEFRFTGLLVLYNNMLQSLFSSQILTLGVVFLCILFMFIVLFQSFSVALIAIVPNILAALSILGTMGLAGLPLDMMTITVAGIALGIGVDGTIHYIHRFKTEITKDGDYINAMRRSHGSIGRAVLYTSVIIIFGFSIMTLSQFIPTIYFGMLTGLAMFAALMASLLLLPKLVLVFKPFKA